MRTWSIEHVLRTLERITRPPRRTGGFDEDAAGEFLGDGAEPPCCCDNGPEFICMPCAAEDHEHCTHGDWCMCESCDAETEYCEAHDIDDTCWMDDMRADYDGDGPDTRVEPPLTQDELVGVRGLLQERYEDQRCTCPSWGNPSWPHRHGCPADPHKTFAASTAKDSPAGVEHPPVPPVGHSEQRIHDVLIEHSRIAVSDTGGAARWGCRCDRTKALGPGGYIDHVLDLLNAGALAPQSIPTIETGHDMGVSFASELFPQHRKTSQ